MSTPTRQAGGFHTCTVTGAELISHDVIRYIIRPSDWRYFGDAAPGAHVSVRSVAGTIRAYSLLPAPAGVLSIAVRVNCSPSQLNTQSTLIPGRRVPIASPRTNLRIEPAAEYRFLAGGIGITPIYSLVHELSTRSEGGGWALDYVVRDPVDLVFLSELAMLASDSGGVVRTHVTRRDGRPDIARLLHDTGPDALVYVCGPSSMVDAAHRWAFSEGRSRQLMTDRADACEREDDVGVEPGDDSCHVELLRSGITVIAPRREPLLPSLLKAGVAVPTSCKRGICGTCEVMVSAGAVDHRDEVLTQEERAAGSSMLPCVSRPLGQSLALDL